MHAHMKSIALNGIKESLRLRLVILSYVPAKFYKTELKIHSFLFFSTILGNLLISLIPLRSNSWRGGFTMALKKDTSYMSRVCAKMRFYLTLWFFWRKSCYSIDNLLYVFDASRVSFCLIRPLLAKLHKLYKLY